MKVTVGSNLCRDEDNEGMIMIMIMLTGALFFNIINNND